jgi:hypothetical protein
MTAKDIFAQSAAVRLRVLGAAGVGANSTGWVSLRSCYESFQKEGSSRALGACQCKQRLERAKKKDMVTVIDDLFGNGVVRSWANPTQWAPHLATADGEWCCP